MARSIDDPDTDPAHRELLRRLGKESSVTVPIVLARRDLGRARGDDRSGHPRLAPRRRAFLRAIADQIVGAIHGAELFAQVEALAYTDPLTGLANRRAVEHELEADVRRRERPRRAGAGAVRHRRPQGGERRGGHEAGDQVLCRAAMRWWRPPRRTRTRWSGASAGTSSACCSRPGRPRRRGSSRSTPCDASMPWVASACRAALPRGPRTSHPAGRAPARGGRGAVPRQARRAGGGRGGGRRGRRGVGAHSRSRPHLPRRRSRRPARPRAAPDARQHERRVGRGAARTPAGPPRARGLSRARRRPAART